MRRVALLTIVVLVIANAGCLGDAEQKAAPSTTPPVAKKNDTLGPLVIHLAAGGKFTTTAPNGTATSKTPTRIATSQFFPVPLPTGSGRADWVVKLATNGTVDKFVGKVFVEVADQTLQGPGMGMSQACRFSISISKVTTGGGGGNFGGGGSGSNAACVSGQAGPVEKGEVAIPIDYKPTTPLALKAGEEVRIRVTANVVSPEQRPVVNVLHGSAKHDSFVEFVNANQTLAAKV